MATIAEAFTVESEGHDHTEYRVRSVLDDGRVLLSRPTDVKEFADLQAFDVMHYKVRPEFLTNVLGWEQFEASQEAQTH